MHDIIPYLIKFIISSLQINDRYNIVVVSAQASSIKVFAVIVQSRHHDIGLVVGAFDIATLEHKHA